MNSPLSGVQTPSASSWSDQALLSITRDLKVIREHQKIQTRAWLKTSKMAELAGLGTSTLRRMAQTGQLPESAVRRRARKTGYEYRFHAENTLRAIEESFSRC